MTNPHRTDIRKDFRLYCKYVLPDFDFKPYHTALIEHIHFMIEGEARQAMVALPPRHGKTLICGLMFLSYMFGRYPERSGAYCTSTDELAYVILRLFGRLVASEAYKELWDNGSSSSIRRGANGEVQNDSGGKVRFTGRGGMMGGIGLHYSTCDDMYKNAEEAASKRINDGVFDWFRRVWRTKADKDSIQLVTGSRMAKDDLMGRIEKNPRLGYDYLRFPLYKDAPHNNDNVIDYRDIGETLGVFDNEEIKKKIRDKDPLTMALYQQQPIL